MQTSSENILHQILEIIGVYKKDQKKILQAYKYLLLATMIAVIKNFLPESKKLELNRKLLKSNNWIRTSAKYAAQINDDQQLVDEISKRLQETTEQFIGILAKECPPSRCQEIIEYASAFMLLR